MEEGIDSFEAGRFSSTLHRFETSFGDGIESGSDRISSVGSMEKNPSEGVNTRYEAKRLSAGREIFSFTALSRAVTLATVF